MRSGLACCLAFALAACATGNGPSLSTSEQSQAIPDTSARQRVEADELLRRARAADIILLGETHDNPAHHALQKRLIDSLRGDSRPSVLVMEQFDIGQQRDIDDILAASLDIDSKLNALGKLMPAGWSWPAYRPVVEAALHQNMPVRAANLPREALRPVIRQGLEALGSAELDRLALTTNWTNAMQSRLEKEIADGHCGLLPTSVVHGMAAAQRARDAVMADRLLAALPMRVVGIVGHGHARKDIAVPWYLSARSPQSAVLAVGLLDSGNAGGNAADGSGARTDYDYIVSTPAVDREKNPCDDIVAPGSRQNQ